MTLSRRTLIGTSLGVATSTAAWAATAPSAQAAPAAEPATPPAGEALSVRTPDGLTLSATAYGDPAAPEILFVHGLGQSGLSWHRQVTQLAARFRLVTFDMRGHGASSAPDSPDAYADGARWAADIRAVREAAGLRRPTLVGWSFGALTVGHHLKHHGADDLHGVVLTGPVTKFSPELLQPRGLEIGGRLASADLSVRIQGIRDTLDATFAGPLGRDEHDRMLVINSLPPRALQLGYGLVGNEGVDEAFGEPSRLYVTYGAKDAITRPEMARRVLDLNPDARLSVYPNAGHAPFYDEPARFNRELARFAAAGARPRAGGDSGGEPPVSR
ncbi:alpha/beta fold hydrolase [Streptomyces fumanus]|uniref:alpha/beta fold hydrolase n=1 Tax=Streptomyces fumanus TaxID=67302 RepID=UPI003403DF3A